MLFLLLTITTALFSVFQGVDADPHHKGFTLSSWNTNDGLPVNAVGTIIQDDQGYLWITTYDGLARFDGMHFKIFNNQNLPGIHSNRFAGAEKDKFGNIWFYPEYGGVMKYRDQEFTFYDETNGFEGGVLTQPLAKHEGLVYFPTQNGLFRYTENGFEQVYYESDPDLNYINLVSIFKDYILVSTNGGLVLSKNGNIEHIYHTKDFGAFELFSNRFFANIVYTLQDGALVLYDLNGNEISPEFNFSADHQFERIISNDTHIFLSSNKGLYVFDRYNPLYPKQHFPDYPYLFYDLILDKDDNIWLREITGKLFQYHGDSLERFNPDGILEGFRVSSMFEDKDRNLWLGTGNRGLVKLNESVVETIGMEHGLPFNNMMNVFKDSRGNIWSGIRMQGLVKIDGDRNVTRYTTFEGIPIHDVVAINENSDGVIHIHLLNHGVGRIHPDGSKDMVILGSSSRTTFVTGIDFWNDRMITATRGGLFIHDSDDNKLFRIDESNGLASERIQKLKITDDGKAWLATIGGGVSKVDLETGEVTNYLESDGLGLNNVRGIYIDQYDEGTVWFTTEGNGISRFRDGSFATANSASGMFEDVVHSVIEDRKGKMWMSSNRGVFYVNKAELNDYLNGKTSYITPVVFGRIDGMAHEECNGGTTNSFHLDDDGRLYYPTQDGIAIFDTNNPNINISRVPVPIIESISVRGKRSEIFDTVVLEPGVNDFTFTFTGLEFSSPERIRFKYKLEGYDKEWLHANGMRTATYTNLPPRNYRFKVMASMSQFPDDLEYASVDINLLPHFYQQWWFYLLAGMVFIFSILFVHRFRVYQLKIRERKLEYTVMKRTKALNEEKNEAMKKQMIIEQQADELLQMNQAKDRFFNIIAHDLKGPVSGIKGLLNLMSDEFDTLSETEKKEFLYYMRESTDNVYELLDNLLSWARLQNKHSEPDIMKTDSEKAIYRALNVLKPVAESKKINLDVRLEDSFSVMADPNMLDTILRNLISNAIKFSYPKSTITIKVESDSKSGYFSVKDTGVGMTKEDQQKLFRPDKSVTRPGTVKEQGTGLGLLICHEMSISQNGELTFESEHGSGTTFTLRLPLSFKSESHGKISA